MESDEGWSGGYLSNDNQIVTAEDAARLGQALKEALPDIPRYSAAEPALVRTDDRWQTLGVESQETRERPEPSLLEQFAGLEGRAVVAEMISFCRLGAFAIR